MLSFLRRLQEWTSGCGDSPQCYFTRLTRQDGSGPTFDQARGDLMDALQSQQWVHVQHLRELHGVQPYKRR